MKITLSPSRDQSREKHPHATVSIEVPGDDMTVAQCLREIIIPAMTAWGYPASNINARIDTNDYNDEPIEPKDYT